MNRFLTFIGKFDLIIERIEVAILSTSVLVMALNSAANVLGRYAFNNSLYFSEELNQFLMISITFVGLSYVTRKGRHIRMSAIYDMLEERTKKYLMLLICLSTALTLFMLAYYAYEFVVKIANRGSVTPALRVPVYLTLLSIPVGFVLTGIQFLFTFIQNLRSEHIYISYSCVDTYEGDEVDVVIEEEAIREEPKSKCNITQIVRSSADTPSNTKMTRETE